MKKILLTLLLGVGFSYTLNAAGYVIVNDNYDYKQTKTSTYKTNYCSRGYAALKKALKKEAKELCARRGNYGMQLLAAKSWKKISCTKIKKKHHKTKVTVTGQFKAMCKVHR